MYETILDLMVTALGAAEGTTLFVTLEVVATCFSLIMLAIPVVIVCAIIVWVLRLLFTR